MLCGLNITQASFFAHHFDISCQGDIAPFLVATVVVLLVFIAATFGNCRFSFAGRTVEVGYHAVSVSPTSHIQKPQHLVDQERSRLASGIAQPSRRVSVSPRSTLVGSIGPQQNQRVGGGARSSLSGSVNPQPKRVGGGARSSTPKAKARPQVCQVCQVRRQRDLAETVAQARYQEARRVQRLGRERGAAQATQRFVHDFRRVNVPVGEFGQSGRSPTRGSSPSSTPPPLVDYEAPDNRISEYAEGNHLPAYQSVQYVDDALSRRFVPDPEDFAEDTTLAVWLETHISTNSPVTLQQYTAGNEPQAEPPTANRFALAATSSLWFDQPYSWAPYTDIADVD
jgi:hypothetical protein